MKKLNGKSIVIIIIIIILIIAMLGLMIISGLRNNSLNNTTTTTTITTTEVQDKELKENIYGISINYNKTNEIEDNHKLEVIKLDEKLDIENVAAFYDINLKDSSNNIVKVNNTELTISVPYENIDNYSSFKVLYLSDTNEVIETIPANYINGKVIFTVNHLSRYAIVGEKDETTTTTTTKRVINNNSQTTTTTPTTKAPVTTEKVTTTTKKTTKKTTTTTTTTTTKAPTTTKKTTTKKVKNYVVKVSIVDQYSPDRILSVFENGNKINVSEIKYNGVTLCYGSNMVVNMFELDGINSVIVILNDGTSVSASIQ